MSLNMLDLIDRSINASIEALGDAIIDVTVADVQPVEQQAGQDYTPSYEFYSGKGAFENLNVDDYPDTQILTTDKSCLLLRCSCDVDTNDFFKAGETTYRVLAVKPDVVGQTRVLQKLLLREEPKEIEWESGGPVVSFTS